MKASVILAGLFAVVSVSAMPQRGADCDEKELRCWKICIVEGRREIHHRACQAQHMDKCEKKCGGKMEKYVSILCGDHIKPVGKGRWDHDDYVQHHTKTYGNVKSQY